MPFQDWSLDEREFAAAETSVVCDSPTTYDSLGFTPYVEAVAAFLISKATEPPLTIAIEGEWGSGKSSFMLQLEKAIAGPSKGTIFLKDLPHWLGGYSQNGSVRRAAWNAWKHRTNPTIRFNAWRHDTKDALWAAFALSFANSLRKRIGFLGGWWGDLRLFLSRLSKLRGWLELCLLLISLVLLLCCFFSAYDHVFRLTHNAEETIWKQDLLDLINNFKSLVSPFAGKQNSHSTTPLSALWESALAQAAKTFGPLGLLFALALTGLIKFHKRLKLPISIDLKKYLSTPDYRGHTAFIESFHEDFARLVKAYGRSRRIFIFVDDLDRCDVPRAAELMQAINLMIGDAGQLVFVLGMDREKVAAGITQKYKDLLPFLTDYAVPLGQLENGSSLLSFGYSYLEKFIQLSFTLPVISGRDALETFLNGIASRSSNPIWLSRVSAYYYLGLLGWLEKVLGGRVVARFRPDILPRSQYSAGVVPLRNADVDSIDTEKRIREIRIKVDTDSSGIRSIVSMVGGMFDYNPRRLKQFVSTFRLALALTSDQGILGLDPWDSGVTPPQLGKFIALTMKFPDLRLALLENHELLSDLERAAIAWPADAKTGQSHGHWLGKRAVREVLLYGVRNVRSDSTSGPVNTPSSFSLLGLNVGRLLSLLPRVPARSAPRRSDGKEPNVGTSAQSSITSPPAYSDATEPTGTELEERFDDLASEYERIRTSQKASDKRTMQMTSVIERAQIEIAQFNPIVTSAILDHQLKKNSAGNRIVALAIACERISESNMAWLLRFLAECRTPFEHYWTIRALQLHERFIDGASAPIVYETLSKLMKSIEQDPGRVKQAKDLQNRAAAIIARRSATGLKV